MAELGVTASAEICGRPPNVLFYDCYPGLYGAQLTLLDLASSLRRVNPMVVTVVDGPLASRARKYNLATVVLRYPQRLRRWDHALLLGPPTRTPGHAIALATYNRRALGLIRASRTDVVYCANLRAVLSIAPAARIARRPVIWHVQNPRQTGTQLEHFAARLATVVVAISPKIVEVLDERVVQRLGGRLRVIPLGTADPIAADVSPRSSDHIFRVCCIGMLHPGKGQVELVEAVERRRDDYPDAPPLHLSFIGDEPATAPGIRALLESRTRQVREPDFVELLGWRDDAAELIREYDCLVLASFSEGVPRVIMEAMARARPVIATDVGGVSDLVINGESGILVQPGDISGLATAIQQLSVDPERCRRLGWQGQTRWAARFRQQAFVHAFESLIHEIARGV